MIVFSSEDPKNGSDKVFALSIAKNIFAALDIES